MDPTQFVSTYYPYAQNVSAQTGLPVAYILGQAGLESGWGGSNIAQTLNNFFGITQSGGGYASYNDPGAGFTAYGNLINSPLYSGAASIAASGGSAYDIANYLNQQGYSTTPDYASRVAGATDLVNQALNSLGLSGGTVSGSGASTSSGTSGTTAGVTGSGTGTAGTSGATLNPATWLPAISSWVGGYATRLGLILLAIVLLIGAVYLFALRTQAVAEAPPVPAK